MTLGGAAKPIGFKKFDVVKVFKNAKHTGGYQMGVISVSYTHLRAHET